MGLSCFSITALRRFVSAFLAAVSLTVSASVVLADQPVPDGAKIFPATLGGFHRAGRITVINKDLLESLKSIDDVPKDASQVFSATTEYESPDGDRLQVSLRKFENDSAAYSQFTLLRWNWREDGAVERVGFGIERHAVAHQVRVHAQLVGRVG